MTTPPTPPPTPVDLDATLAVLRQLFAEHPEPLVVSALGTLITELPLLVRLRDALHARFMAQIDVVEELAEAAQGGRLMEAGQTNAWPRFEATQRAEQEAMRVLCKYLGAEPR